MGFKVGDSVNVIPESIEGLHFKVPGTIVEIDNIDEVDVVTLKFPKTPGIIRMPVTCLVPKTEQSE